MQSSSITESKKAEGNFEKFKIVHIAGLNDQLQTGIADYAYNLAKEQQAQNIDTLFISSKEEPASNTSITTEDKYRDDINKAIIAYVTWKEFIPEKGKKFSESEQKLNDLKKQEMWKSNENILEGLKEALEEKGQTIIWHFHFAVGHCGDIVSPEWLQTQRAVATIHEYKTETDEKSLKKRELTERYIKAVNGHIIANEATFEQIKKDNIPLARDAAACAVPPNIDTTSLLEQELSSATYDYTTRKNNTIHYGMMREGKGIEEVIEAQKEADNIKSKELAGSLTIIVGAVPKDGFDYYKHIAQLIFTEQTLAPENLKKLGVTHPEIFEKDFFLNDMNETESAVNILVDTVRKLETAYEANTTDINIEKKVNICLAPNAGISDVRKLISNSRRAYLPFDRGATPHSGSLPTCINLRTVIITKEGKETPEHYKEVMIFAKTPQEAALWYQKLEEKPALYTFYSKAAKEKIKVASFTDVAEIAKPLYSAVVSESKEIRKIETKTTSASFTRENSPFSQTKVKKLRATKTTPTLMGVSEKDISDEEMAYSPFGQGSFTAKILREKQQHSISKGSQYL